jgi:hypothetical protein
MGNASGRADDTADADMDEGFRAGNHVRGTSSVGYVRGGGSPPGSPPRPHSPRMFVPQVRSRRLVRPPPRFSLAIGSAGATFDRRGVRRRGVVVDRLGFARRCGASFFFLALVSILVREFFFFWRRRDSHARKKWFYCELVAASIVSGLLRALEGIN